MSKNSKTTTRTGSDAITPEMCRCCLSQLIDQVCDGDVEDGPWWVESLAARSQGEPVPQNGTFHCCLAELIEEECGGDTEGGPWWVELLQERVQACRQQPKER